MVIVIRPACLCFHKGGLNTCLPIAVSCIAAYHNMDIVYREPYYMVCTMIHWYTGVSFRPQPASDVDLHLPDSIHKQSHDCKNIIRIEFAQYFETCLFV